MDHTVQATSGSAAASTSDSEGGRGSSWEAGTVTLSAYPPPASRAHTCETREWGKGRGSVRGLRQRQGQKQGANMVGRQQPTLATVSEAFAFHTSWAMGGDTHRLLYFHLLFWTLVTAAGALRFIILGDGNCEAAVIILAAGNSLSPQRCLAFGKSTCSSRARCKQWCDHANTVMQAQKSTCSSHARWL